MFFKNKKGFLQESAEGKLYDIQILLPKRNMDELSKKLTLGENEARELSQKWNINTKKLELESSLFKLLHRVQNARGYQDIKEISEHFELKIEVQVQDEHWKHTYNSHGSYPDESFDVWGDLEGLYKDCVLVNSSPDIVIAKYFVREDS